MIRENKFVKRYLRFFSIRVNWFSFIRKNRNIDKYDKSETKCFVWKKIRRVTEILSDLRKFLTEIIFFLVGGFFVTMLFMEILYTPIIILPISTPEELSKRGYTPDVFAKRIVNEMLYIDQKAETYAPRQSILGEKKFTDIKLPGELFSFYTLARFFKKLFHKEDIHILIDITQEKDTYIGKIRSYGGEYHNLTATVIWKVTGDIEIFIQHIAKKTMQLVAPYILSRYEIMDIESQNYFEQQRNERLKGVICIYEEMLNRLPEEDDKWALLGTGLVQEKIGEKQKAIETYERLIRKDPKFAFAYGNLAIIQSENGNYAEANNKFEIAIKLYPEFRDTYYNYGFALLKQKKYNEAIKKFEEAVNRDNKFIAAYFNWGKALAEMNKFMEADEQFQAIKKNDPKDHKVYFHIAGIYSRNNDKIRSYNWLLEAINKNDINRKDAREDENFNNIRKEEWFKSLVCGNE